MSAVHLPHGKRSSLNRRNKIFGALVSVPLGIGLMFGIAANAADEAAEPVPPTGSTSVEPPFADRGPIVSSQDVSNPSERYELTVWRNGAFHKVSLRLTRTLLVHQDGSRTESVSPSESDLEGQLPPRDPAFDNVNPTPEQEKAARVSVGATDAGLPPPPGP